MKVSGESRCATSSLLITHVGGSSMLFYAHNEFLLLLVVPVTGRCIQEIVHTLNNHATTQNEYHNDVAKALGPCRFSFHLMWFRLSDRRLLPLLASEALPCYYSDNLERRRANQAQKKRSTRFHCLLT